MKPKPIRPRLVKSLNYVRGSPQGFVNARLNEPRTDQRFVGFTDPRRPSWEWPDEEDRRNPPGQPASRPRT